MKTITAYLRLHNEEKTILSCLDSIYNIFDSILILYSDITDNSLDLINKYFKSNKINIVRYKYSVLPQGSKQYKTNTYQQENSLAAYYQYGLQFIESDYWIKIDADQIYFTDRLKIYFDEIKNSNNILYYYDLSGYNCSIMENNIAINKKYPINGLLDHIIYPNNKEIQFIQSINYEKIKIPNHLRYNKLYNKRQCWFHLRDIYKFVEGYNVTEQDRINFSTNNTIKFTYNQVIEYKQYVLPLLQKYNSPYQYLNINE